ncbi:hypothetical protein [Burkholderia phage FLC9]|nr:hypothetical protein [Burkholderia phage FLC9]
METKVGLIRKDSRGITGTYENADHHAEYIRPFIEAMEGAVKHLGFASWRQGHNVHEFHCTDGRKFTLRPIVQDKDKSRPYYCGIRLSLRESRSVEHWLVDITEVSEVPNLLTMMRLLAKPKQGRLNTGAEAKEAA